jgi:cytoskeletal protein CcmA (bactofilin family)
MFTRKPEADSSRTDAEKSALPPTRLVVTPQQSNTRPAPAAQPGPRANGPATVIGADLIVTGNLESKGDVHIEGEVRGDIHAKRIVISQRARTTGTLVAEEIMIGGSAQGSIRGNSVTFQSSSRVEADVFHKSLTIEQGAYFEGRSRRSDDPLSVPTATSVRPST